MDTDRLAYKGLRCLGRSGGLGERGAHAVELRAARLDLRLDAAARLFERYNLVSVPVVDESERLVGVLRLEGVCLLTNVDDVYIGHPDFEPLYAELDRLKVATFIHPCYPPGKEARDYDIPRMLIDYPFETTKVATNLIFNGVTSRYPDIPFILSHAGGTLPMLAHRLSIFDKLTKFRDNYPEGALAHIARFYYDTALSGHAAPLTALRAFVPDTQILFGTDYPYRTPAETAQGLANCGFSAAELREIDCDNALRLLSART